MEPQNHLVPFSSGLHICHLGELWWDDSLTSVPFFAPSFTSLFPLRYTYFPSPCPRRLPPRRRVGGGGGEKRVRGKVSLHKTRIERRGERRGAEGFTEMGTVCLFAGGCCCSPFPACSICIRLEVLYMCHSLWKLGLIRFCSPSFIKLPRGR